MRNDHFYLSIRPLFPEKNLFGKYRSNMPMSSWPLHKHVYVDFSAPSRPIVIKLHIHLDNDVI